MKIPIPDSIRQITDSEDRQLAWEFFVFFSRFEYALKRTAGTSTGRFRGAAQLGPVRIGP